jgi:hypothetical protein
MLLMLRIDSRPSTNIGFYEQMNFEQYRDYTYAFYKIYMPFVKKYDDRYSDNLLVRYSLWEFASVEHLGAWNYSPSVRNYLAARKVWNDERGITSTTLVNSYTPEIAKNSKLKLVSETWPKSCLVINEVQEFMPDRFVTDAKKPANDRLIFEPWTVTLL